MRDQLLDLVSHTFDLGCIDAIKITGDNKETRIDAIAEDKSVVVSGQFHVPVAEFAGVFGMPNLSKLKILLNLQEYREDAVITVKHQDRDGKTEPVGLYFSNPVGDFVNDYRFMTSQVVTEQIKTAKFRGANWNVEFEPTVAGVQRMKMQAQANSDEIVFKVKTDKENLKFLFGDHSTHAGEFVFHSGITGALKTQWSWPVRQFIGILDLHGDKTVRISDQGAAEIVVDSGIASYSYILPAQSK